MRSTMFGHVYKYDKREEMRKLMAGDRPYEVLVQLVLGTRGETFELSSDKGDLEQALEELWKVWGPLGQGEGPGHTVLKMLAIGSRAEGDIQKVRNEYPLTGGSFGGQKVNVTDVVAEDPATARDDHLLADWLGEQLPDAYADMASTERSFNNVVEEWVHDVVRVANAAKAYFAIDPMVNGVDASAAYKALFEAASGLRGNAVTGGEKLEQPEV